MLFVKRLQLNCNGFRFHTMLRVEQRFEVLVIGKVIKIMLDFVGIYCFNGRELLWSR